MILFVVICYDYLHGIANGKKPTNNIRDNVIPLKPS